MFATNKWKQCAVGEKNKKISENLLNFLYVVADKSIDKTFLEKLTESIYQSNFVPANMPMIQLVMINYINTKNFNMAMNYYQNNLAARKLSVLELLLLKNFVARNESPDLAKQNIEHLKVLLELMAKSFSWDFIYNSLFWAHIMNRNYRTAQQIYETDLKTNLDLSVLRRVTKQMNNYSKYPELSVRTAMKSLHNIYGFEPFKNQPNILKKISGILPKINNANRAKKS